jgi:hypothetical protein
MQSEKDRIEKEGGLVVWAGTWRVGGVLAVSRAFGDRMLKRYVIATPDIREEWLSSEDDLLILASDGVWDVLSNQVRGQGTAADAAGSGVGGTHAWLACSWGMRWCNCLPAVLLHPAVQHGQPSQPAGRGRQARVMYTYTARHTCH